MNGKATNSTALCVRGLSHWFGAVQAVGELSLDIARGEFVALVGPSGCGKTTLLNLLSDHQRPSSGTIERPGGVRMVYQQDGLFPWLTAADNIALGLRHLRDPQERERQLRELLHVIRLQEFRDAYPHQLSGGMRQRVELARALAGDTDVLLMDEPFSALDYFGRLSMRAELVRILRDRPRTVVFVTHDIQEATQLADRVLVLSERPARLRGELEIHSPRPRSVTDPASLDAVQQILELLGWNSTRESPADSEWEVESCGRPPARGARSGNALRSGGRRPTVERH